MKEEAFPILLLEKKTTVEEVFLLMMMMPTMLETIATVGVCPVTTTLEMLQTDEKKKEKTPAEGYTTTKIFALILLR